MILLSPSTTFDNTPASVAQFYSDNLREETLKGLNEKVQQGWLPTHAPYGYVNDPDDPAEPIKVHPEHSPAVVRMFQLFSLGDLTLDGVGEKLAEEGYVYQPANPRFRWKTVSYILNNPFYAGDINWHGRRFPGKHKPLIDRGTFEVCKDLLSGRNRRIRQVNLPLSGGLFRCRYCGYAITGEEIKKRQSDGTFKNHVYYRCSNHDMPPSHPKVRWRASDLKQAIVDQLNGLRLPPEVTAWFREALRASLSDEETYRKKIRRVLQKRESELFNKKAKLLDTYLAGDVEQETFQEKNEGLKAELARVQEEMASETKVNAEFADMATAIFDLTQKAAETWLGSCNSVRRELLEILCTNRELDEVSLRLTWRCPFDEVAKTAISGYGVAERT
ncbi:MAG: recombinase family protein [Planctomycetota bacterium]|nr:recombinase family protein [Planctomycetota bacterium]